MSDTRPVRPSEQLDWDKLAAYLADHLEVVGSQLSVVGEPSKSRQEDNRQPTTDNSLTVEQFPGGHSNLTYALTFRGRELVLRRPPFGPVPPRAHDMAREFRVLSAVHPHFSLAPQPFLLCDDLDVIGSVFYVMERRHGLIIRGDEPAGLELWRERISGAVVDTLADLHAVDIAAHGLDSLGKAAGFVTRQVRGWTERWQGSKTSEIPEMDWLAHWLEERVPADPAKPTLVHGDYKLDNVMLDPDRPDRLAGVFDWEMSAVGDPLVDVGILLCYWIHAVSTDTATAGVTKQAGWYTREQILARYAERSGRSVADIAFYEVFAVFKLAVVAQQIYARFVRGQTDDPRFAGLGERVVWLAQIAKGLT